VLAYQVWVSVEEYDSETGRGNDVICDVSDEPFATFATEQEAIDFAQSLPVRPDDREDGE